MKYCAWETPGHSHLCGTVTGCLKNALELHGTESKNSNKDRSCLKGHRKISGQTYALFLGPGHVPLYLPPPLSPFFILYTRAHRPTHPHTLTPCFVPFPWSWGRFRWCWERDGDSSKKDIISGHVKRLKEETANLHEASWHASWRILHALSPTLSKKTWDRKFKLPFFLRHTLFLFYRRSERRKEVRGSYADFHISRLPS